jgi:hypothetical protein
MVTAALMRLQVDESQQADPARARIEEMLGRGFTLGMGKSTQLGWFEIRGFSPGSKRAVSSRFVISCDPEERKYVFSQTLRHTGCKAGQSTGDTIHTVVEIVPCLMS